MPALKSRRGAVELAVAVLVFAVGAALIALPASSRTRPADRHSSNTRPVLFVGNNWDGTADVINPARPRASRGSPGSTSSPTTTSGWPRSLIDPVRPRLLPRDPPADRRGPRPVRRRHVHLERRPAADRLAAELRGRVGIDLDTGEIVWRFVVDGQRSDHMAISPDGRQVAVSASTGNVVHILDIETGKEVGPLRVRRLAAREHLLRGREADLPRQHRPRLHARRPPQLDTTQGRALLPGRRRERPTRSSSASTWARSSTRPAIRT